MPSILRKQLSYFTVTSASCSNTFANACVLSPPIPLVSGVKEMVDEASSGKGELEVVGLSEDQTQVFLL